VEHEPDRVQRDVAHLWTGRNMTGSTIGIAYLGVICGGSSYGVDQIRFSNNFNSRVALFAHELGHNWDASEHCNDDSECRIMCAGLGGCDGLGNPVRFAAGPITEMSAHVASRSCVDNIGVDLPVAEVFNGGTLDPALWGLDRRVRARAGRVGALRLAGRAVRRGELLAGDGARRARCRSRQRRRGAVLGAGRVGRSPGAPVVPPPARASRTSAPR
jgi:hypothetical protein